MNRLLLFAAGTLAFLNATSLASPEEKERTRGWLGVSVQDVTEKTAKKYDLKIEDGAYVTDVIEQSPAESAGLQEGDVIVEFSGRKIYDASDLSKTVKRTMPGTKTTLVVMRNGEKKTMQVEVGKHRHPPVESFMHHAPRFRFRMFHTGSFFGMSVQTLNEQLAEYFGAPNKEGVLINEVGEGSPAERAGLKAGDVILRVGSRTIEDIDDLRKALRKYDDGEKAEVEFLRKGSKKTVTLEIDEKSEGPWGLALPETPEIHGIPRRDGNYEFEFDIQPDLERFEKRLERLGPTIEAEMKRLDKRMKNEIVSVIKIRTI